MIDDNIISHQIGSLDLNFVIHIFAKQARCPHLSNQDKHREVGVVGKDGAHRIIYVYGGYSMCATLLRDATAPFVSLPCIGFAPGAKG